MPAGEGLGNPFGHVDLRVASLSETWPGRDVSGPKPMSYGPDYYAVFVSDPSGNRFEVY